MNQNWKDLASEIGKFAPALGTLIGGPAGTAIGAMVAAGLGVGNTPDAVSQALATNPEAAVKLREIESNERVKLQELLVTQASAQISADSKAITDVNTTMQAEAKSEHWPTWFWRPMIGMAVGLNVGASSLLVLIVGVGTMLGNPAAGAAMSQLPLVLGALAGINTTVLPILGIASWLRGKMQNNPDTPTVQLPRGVTAADVKGVPPPPNPFAAG